MSATRRCRYRPNCFAPLRWLLGGLAVALWSTVGQATERPPQEAVPQLESSEWWQWRGPSRTGHLSDEAPAWPSELQADHLQELWRKPLDPSYSGPIVSRDFVYVTETQGEEREVVTALHRHDGEPAWQQQWPGAMTVPFFASANGSWIRATPAFDGDSLFVAGMRDRLTCLDGKSGEVRWVLDFMQQYDTPLPAFGFVCSPLVDGDRLYVQAASSVCCVDKRNGKVLWRALDDGGGMSGSAFSSPIIATILGQRQLVVQTRSALAGLELEQGGVLWKHDIPAYQGMNIVTPSVIRLEASPIQDALFTSSYGGQTLLLQPRREGDTFRIEETWRNKLQGYMSSPIILGGHAYLHLRNQRFACINLATGKEAWITKPFGQYWSMVAHRDRILALDANGELLLLAANPAEFQILDRRNVSSSPAWAHLAVAGDELFIRDLKGISAYRWK